MPWFKVDDTLHGHPKARKAGLEAVGLWAVAGAYCSAYKTDGFVPEWYVSSWRNGRKLASRLVNAKVVTPTGFWEPATKNGEPGWQFHDWDHFQPSAEEIEEDRENARERQRKRRKRLREARDAA